MGPSWAHDGQMWTHHAHEGGIGLAVAHTRCYMLLTSREQRTQCTGVDATNEGHMGHSAYNVRIHQTKTEPILELIVYRDTTIQAMFALS